VTNKLSRLSCVCILSTFFGVGLSTSALPADQPDWAFHVRDKVQPPETPDDGKTKQMPGSQRSYTASELSNPEMAPDWFPDEHPPMPKIVANGAPKVRACGTCHLATGYGRPENSSVAGLPKAYFMRQMDDFKSGKRQGNASMTAIAKAITPEDLEAAAAYFERIKQVPWTRVVETDLVPRTFVGKGNMRFVLPGGTEEPIGQRIIEVPEDAFRAEARDPHSPNIAYVPKGSVAKGEALVLNGGGKTVACTSCHGGDLRGMGEFPPIAGRSAIYVVRQLFLIKTGQRTSDHSQTMNAAVKDLELEDMIAIAAYVAAQNP
jgi:cytochrome c553